MNRRKILHCTAAAFLAAGKLPGAEATLPKLPYAVDALEPFVDARTMEIHHGKHHQAYVDNLNKALATQPALAGKPVEELLKNLSAVPDSIRGAVRNNGGGHWNHSLFWQTLGPNPAAPKGKLAAAIAKAFGRQAAFEDKLRAAGLSVFGSGWVWVTTRNGLLTIETSPNQDSPLMSGLTPVFGIDVWVHAYYLKYQNRRADYLAAVMKVIHWDFVSRRYEEVGG
ncbi:MAG: superoxide dismutase [Bryobacterales bacterium]|nr:superoxide dismutase [Bryobacterales bacterium]